MRRPSLTRAWRRDLHLVVPFLQAGNPSGWFGYGLILLAAESRSSPGDPVLEVA